MNEWEFTSRVATWITLILERNLELPFQEAYCEGQSNESPQRRDLSIKDRNGRVILTGEVKLPGQQDGATPYNAKVVSDARQKARRAGVRFFFTWNVNQCVLWETEGSEAHPRPDYMHWSVTNVHTSKALEFPDVQAEIKRWLPVFLHDTADVMRGASVIPRKSPDEKFIDSLEAALQVPVTITTNSLLERYRTSAVRSELDAWMRNELGFTILTDPEGIRSNLERAAKHACYGLANKLVFYEALLKRYGALLPPLTVPDHITEADPLRTHLESHFADARRVTSDYETVFGENALGLASRVPFYNSGVVESWRAFVSEIHEFDFSRLDYEVIGNIFERLISPEERRKYGQFYTRAEIVDLINSFAIRSGNETVMDPACGGGTFLVRAYVRKRELVPQSSHAQRLREIFGVDVSHFATHLTTINLATRDLIDDANYPQIARNDFFNISPRQTVFTLPRRITTAGLGSSNHRDVVIPELDVVIGNPPYIRQEELSQTYKARLQEIATHNGANLTGRSDIHAYFWPHGAAFLKEGGYLCFLTSSQWLDTDYGFRLQEWILRHFEVVAVLESSNEPWFVGARVATAVTILRRQSDTEKRMKNITRFAQLRRPMHDLLPNDGTSAGAVIASDNFRDELLSIQTDVESERYAVRLVKQEDLWRQGVNMGVAVKRFSPPTGMQGPQTGQYFGVKWGIYLRAPRLWFEYQSRFGERLTPLGKLAEVRFGVKSGRDSFFFPVDATEEALKVSDPQEFKLQLGASREAVESGQLRIVRCGDGLQELRPIEREYLEPEVHSIRGWNRFSVLPEDCSRLILLVPSGRHALQGTYVLRYIEWGEQQGVHNNSTCQGRISESREWYDLTASERASVILPKIQQYRLFAILNESQLYQASALLGVHDRHDLSPVIIAGLLNSTLGILSRILHARLLGNEGNIQLDVYSAEMMLIPDPRHATERQKQRIVEAFNQMSRREVLSFVSDRRRFQNSADSASYSEETELTQADRQNLDDAVFEMLGVSNKDERRRLLAGLYAYLTSHFDEVRRKEELAIANKLRAQRSQAVRPTDLVNEIAASLEREQGSLLRTYHELLDTSKPYDSYEIPVDARAELLDDLFHSTAIRFLEKGSAEPTVVSLRNTSQRELLSHLMSNGMTGIVRVPVEDAEVERVAESHARIIEERETALQMLVEERTADPDMQQRVLDGLRRRYQYK